MASKLPYPGLRPFHRDESDIFFGREEQTDELLRKLDNSRFLAVIGPSGCGKSSLVRAGMIAALESGFMVSAGARWRIAALRPGSHPILRLAEALMDDTAMGTERAGYTDSMAFLNSTLRRGPLGLIEALNETPLPEKTNLLILVDQFEEIFRYQRESNSDEADAFVELLLETAAHKKSPVFIVITMRSDYLGDCAVFSGLPEALNAGQYLTPRMNRDQRREAIVGPSRVFGGDVDDDLVNHLLNETGGDPKKLPVLQHLLMRMWECTQPEQIKSESKLQGYSILGEFADESIGHRLTMIDYKDVGGIENGLSNHADDAFSTLNTEQQRISEIMFRSLCECGARGRYNRRPTSIYEIARLASKSPEQVITPEQVISIVGVFRKPEYGFIIPAQSEQIYPNTMIDISHESLILQWNRVKGWVNEEAKSVEIYQFLEKTACRWKEGKAAEWGTPDLENAEAWKNHNQPTAEWARRFGAHFETAMEFLNASRNKRDLENKKLEEARRKKFTQLRTRSFIYILLLIISIVLGAWGWIERGNAKWEKTKSHSNELAFIAQEALNYDQELSALLIWHAAYETHAHSNKGMITKGVQKTLYKVLDESRIIGRLTGHSDSILSTAFSDDNSLVATGGIDRDVIIWSTDSLKKQHILNHDDWVTGVVFSKHDKSLITTTDRGKIYRWDIKKEKKTELITVPDSPEHIAIRSDLLRMASATEGSVRIWDMQTKKGIDEPISINEKITEIKFIDNKLYITTNNGSVYVVDHSSNSLKIIFQIPKSTELPKVVKLSPKANYLATTSFDGTIKLWDLKTNKINHSIVHKKLGNIAFSPDGNSIVSYSVDNKIKIWNVVTGKHYRTLNGHKGYIDLVAFSNNSKLLVSASDNKDLFLWNVEYGYFQRAVRSIFSNDLNLIATLNRKEGRHPQVVTLRNTKTDELTVLPHFICNNQKADYNTVDMTISGTVDRKYLILLTENGEIISWDIMSKNYKCQKLTQEKIHLGSFSPNGEHAAYSDKKSAYLFNIQTEVESKPITITNDHEELTKVIFHPNGKWLVVTIYNPRIFSYRTELLDIASRNVFRTHKFKTHELVFSPDDKYMITYNQDKAIISNPDTQETIRNLIKKNEIRNAIFSPDNKYLATYEEKEVKLWNVGSWDNEFIFTSDNKVTGLAFSHDDKRLMISYEDNSIKTYPLEIDDLINKVRNRLKRNLTEEECEKYLKRDECPKATDPAI